MPVDRTQGETATAGPDEVTRNRTRSTTKASAMALWATSPAIVIAIIGLIGTAIGAGLQGFWNTRLERQKFEARIIQRALDKPDQRSAKTALQFFANAGLITSIDITKIDNLRPEEIPISFRITSVKEVKDALRQLKLYTGNSSDDADDAFLSAVRSYQRSKGLTDDGFVGQLTYQKLREDVPTAFKAVAACGG